MKTIIQTGILAALLLVPSVHVSAHDEGHGPKLTDTAQQGGVIAPVIDKKEVKKGAKAAVVYKAELVRSEDGTVRVYLYDKTMNPLNLSGFDVTAKGIVEMKKNKKWTTVPFTLKLQDDSFTGIAPKAVSKPFNIDVTLTEKGRELLSAFDNLD
jgi:hypothetical protein